MTAKKPSLTFEESLVRLEEIVRHLEKGDLPLGDTLKLYEEGTGLIASCSRIPEAPAPMTTLIFPPFGRRASKRASMPAVAPRSRRNSSGRTERTTF